LIQMKITEIKHQLNRTDRYSIYIDGTYAFALSERGLLAQGLRVGLELNSSELSKLKQDALEDKAYDRAINLILRRPRSEWELRLYLKRKEYNQEIIDSVVARLQELDYVNDKDFARRWIESRRLLKSTSRRRIEQELRQKRVPDDVIKETLESDETDEKDVLRELVERKRQQTKYHDNLKLMQYLSRQGFSYEDIKTALNQEIQEQ
jgi:regulatory protein